MENSNHQKFGRSLHSKNIDVNDVLSVDKSNNHDENPVYNLWIVGISSNRYCGERLYSHKMWIKIVDMLITFVDKVLLTEVIGC